MESQNKIRVMLGTANSHKVGEIRKIWSTYPLEAITLPSDREWPDAPETGVTYLENAIQKAKFYFELTGKPCVADDSGLEVEALNWKPGVHTKRFTPEGLSQQERLQFMLDHLKEIENPDKRRARYRCVAVAYGFTIQPLIATGELDGWISFSPSGWGGFGYDPIFHLDNSDLTLAQVSEDKKNEISHRGQAMRKLANLLLENCQ